jgi:hypothetical protein
MISPSTDPWLNFLHARKLCIDELFKVGRTPDEIARQLSMDADQALLIAMTAVMVNRHGKLFVRRGGQVDELTKGLTAEQIEQLRERFKNPLGKAT